MTIEQRERRSRSYGVVGLDKYESLTLNALLLMLERRVGIAWHRVSCDVAELLVVKGEAGAALIAAGRMTGRKLTVIAMGSGVEYEIALPLRFADVARAFGAHENFPLEVSRGAEISEDFSSVPDEMLCLIRWPSQKLLAHDRRFYLIASQLTRGSISAVALAGSAGVDPELCDVFITMAREEGILSSEGTSALTVNFTDVAAQARDSKSPTELPPPVPGLINRLKARLLARGKLAAILTGAK